MPDSDMHMFNEIEEEKENKLNVSQTLDLGEHSRSKWCHSFADRLSTLIDDKTMKKSQKNLFFIVRKVIEIVLCLRQMRLKWAHNSHTYAIFIRHIIVKYRNCVTLYPLCRQYTASCAARIQRYSTIYMTLFRKARTSVCRWPNVMSKPEEYAEFRVSIIPLRSQAVNRHCMWATLYSGNCLRAIGQIKLIHITLTISLLLTPMTERRLKRATLTKALP